MIEYDGNKYDLEIVNQVSSENLMLSDSKAIISVNIEQYLTDNFSIQFQVLRIGANNGEGLQTPKITLKGAPAK